jgi:hypothetical protein
MFRAFSRPSLGAQWLQWQPPVLPSYHGNSRALVRGRWTLPGTVCLATSTEHTSNNLPHIKKLKAASAVLGFWWWAVCGPKHVELYINREKMLIHCCILLDISSWIVLWCTDPRTSSVRVPFLCLYSLNDYVRKIRLTHPTVSTPNSQKPRILIIFFVLYICLTITSFLSSPPP